MRIFKNIFWFDRFGTARVFDFAFPKVQLNLLNIKLLIKKNYHFLKKISKTKSLRTFKWITEGLTDAVLKMN